MHRALLLAAVACTAVPSVAIAQVGVQTPEQRLDTLIRALAARVTTQQLAVSGPASVGALSASTLALGTPLPASQGGTGSTAIATVATSGAYADLTGRPSLGTAAAANVGTTAGTVAAGDDSRITGAAQNAAAAITGGTINGASIGATAAAPGRFTTLTSTGAATLASLNVAGAVALAATTVAGQLKPTYVDLVDRGDWTIRFLNSAGADIGSYMGLSGILAGPPTNALRGRNDAGTYLGVGTTVLLGLTAAGYVTLPGLPTSASGLPSGALWRDSAAGSILKVVP